MADLESLTRCAPALCDPALVAEEVVKAAGQVCPEGLAYVYTLAGHPSPELQIVRAAMDGRPVDLEGWREAYIRGRVGYDRSAVEATQRDRWVEPLGRFISRTSYTSNPIYHVVRPHGVCHFGRVLICEGDAPVAYVGMSLPTNRPKFRAHERSALFEIARKASLPLKMAIRHAKAHRASASLAGMLSQLEHPAILLDRHGVLLAEGSRASSLLSMRPELRTAASDAVRAGRRRVAVGPPERGFELRVSPCPAPRSAPTFIVALVPTSVGRRETLTARQVQMLDLLLEGLSNTEIAQHLAIEPTTVKTVFDRLRRKTRSRSRIALATWWSRCKS